MHPNYNIDHIISKLPYSLPTPFPTLQSMFYSLPNEYHSEELFQALSNRNRQFIETHLSQILKNCSQSISQIKYTSDFEGIAKQFAQVLRAYPSNGNLYSQKIMNQSYGLSTEVNGVENYVYALFNLIGRLHSENYRFGSIPHSFSPIINQQMNQLYGNQGGGIFTLEENSQLQEIQKAQLNAKLLKEQLKTSNLLMKKSSHNEIGKNVANNLYTGKRVQKKIDSIHENNQGTIYESFQNSLYQQLNFYQFHTLNHFFETITLEHISKLQRFPYIQSGNDALVMAINLLNQKMGQAPQYMAIFKQMRQKLNFGLGFYQNQGSNGLYYEIQSWMIIMVHIYKCLADNYTTYARKILKLIFTSFSNQDLQNTIQVLRWLQNNRDEVRNLSDNYAQIQQKASYLLIEIHKNRENVLQTHKPKQIPQLRLLLLSGNKPRRKTVNIWVSGFLSEDMDKDSQWGQLLSIMPDSEVYGLQWQSDSIKNLVKFIAKSSKNMLFGGKFSEQFKKTLEHNPFNPAFEVANSSGRYLAQLVTQLFPSQFINIAGYSLGSELIKQFLQRMIEVGKQNQLSNIYMMGGVSDVEQMKTVVSKSQYPLTVYNCYTGNDMVLKHILPMSKPDLHAIGITEIPEISGHEIINVDCSKFISGHLAYMTNFDLVGKVVEMNEE